MILLLLGAPGGGKSYEAVVYHVLPALQQGRKVITNLPLDLERFRALDPSFPDLIELRTIAAPVRGQWTPGGEGSAFKVSKVPQASDVTRRPFAGVWCFYSEWQHPEQGIGPLYVIDECHLSMPRGSTDRHLEEWFSLHRHYRADVLLITQSYGKVSRAIVDLVQVVYRVRKNVALGSSNSYTRKVQDGVRGEVVNTAIRKYEKKFFGLYRSHTQTGAGKEAGASDVRPIWRHWSVYGALACVGTLAVMLGSGSVANPLKPQPPKAQPHAKAPALPASQPAQVQQLATAANSPASSPALEAEAPAPKGHVEPFAQRGLHLTGVIKMGERVRYSFVLSQNGQHVAALTDEDLRAAGYEWRPTGHCHGEAIYGATVRAVICDAPQIQINVPGMAPGRPTETPAGPQGGARSAGGPAAPRA